MERLEGLDVKPLLIASATVALLALTLTAPQGAIAQTAGESYNDCKEGLVATDAVTEGSADMACMNCATLYAGQAHSAALNGNAYDRDRYRLLAGTCYVAAGNLETRIGDTDDAHNEFISAATLLKEAASSKYASIRSAAIYMLETATGH